MSVGNRSEYVYLSTQIIWKKKIEVAIHANTESGMHNFKKCRYRYKYPVQRCAGAISVINHNHNKTARNFFFPVTLKIPTLAINIFEAEFLDHIQQQQNIHEPLLFFTPKKGGKYTYANYRLTNTTMRSYMSTTMHNL